MRRGSRKDVLRCSKNLGGRAAAKIETRGISFQATIAAFKFAAKVEDKPLSLVISSLQGWAPSHVDPFRHQKTWVSCYGFSGFARHRHVPPM